MNTRTCTGWLFLALVGTLPVAQPVQAQDVTVPPAPMASFTADGMNTGTEYNGAANVSLSGSEPMEAEVFIYRYRDSSTGDEEVRLYFSVHDTDANADDRIDFYFDLLNNGGTTGDQELDEDVLFRINRTECGGGGPTCEAQRIQRQSSGLFVGSGASVTLSDARILASNAGEYSGAPAPYNTGWTGELVLQPADLGWSYLPASVGLAVVARSSGPNDIGPGPDGTDPEASFPSGADLLEPVNWADLLLRYPLDYMIVLDQSGSMLSDDKWEDATQAANFLANTMSIFRDPNHFDDRIGVVTFDWDCSGSDETSIAEALAVPASELVGDYTGGLSDPESSNCTPIASGLETAFTALNASQDDETIERERAALLLSDGLHNRPSSTFTPGDTGYDPCPTTPGWNACPTELSNVPVSTVAFGSGDWGVDTDLLADVTTRYQGETAQEYNLTDSEALKGVFVQNVAEYYDANLIKDDAATSFALTSGNAKLLVIASWPTPTTAPEDIAVSHDTSGDQCDISDHDDTVGFSVCVINNPQDGTWTVTAADGTFDGGAPATIYSVVDLRVRARFALDRVAVPTGDPIRLTVNLRDFGQPVLHDPANHPVRVTADVERPDEAVGTFASTHQPSTCELRDPVLPQIDPRLGQTTRAVSGLAIQPSAFRPATRTGADPNPPLFQLMNTLLGACNRSGLGRSTVPDLVLRDDGTQGDATANDGIYTAEYADTEVEGTYVFQFSVDGTTADGAAFTRTKRLSAYVGVVPDPGSSVIGSRVIRQQDGQVLREFYILPRDRFGGYLGPGKTRVVAFTLVAGTGTFVGPEVVDYGNGYYSRFIRHPEGQVPVVTSVVRGEPVEDRGGIPGAELGLYVGRTIFDNALQLDDGWGLGGHIGAPLFGTTKLYGEIELASTFTNVTAADTVRLAQVLGNLRYDLVRTQPRTLAPFVAVGVGVGRLWGEGDDETVGLLHASGGLSYFFSRRVGLRFMGRALRMSSARGADASINLQVTGGVVLRLPR